MATRLAPCHPDVRLSPRNMGQPAFAQTNGLNQNAGAIGEDDTQPARTERVRQNLPYDEDGHTGASDGREQPDNLKLARAPAARNHKSAIKAGEADGENKRADERHKRQRIGGRAQADEPESEYRRDNEQRAGHCVGEADKQLVADEDGTAHAVTSCAVGTRVGSRSSVVASMSQSREEASITSPTTRRRI